MAYTYQNLENYRNTGSGIAERVYLAPHRWFDQIAAPPEGGILIEDSHSFLEPAYGFVSFLLAPDKNQLDARTIGNIGSQKFEHEARIFIPGSYAQAHETVANLINEPVIVLIPDADCEEELYYQLGNKCTPAWIKCDFSTGTTLEGQKGYLGTISFIGKGVFIYDGEIQLPDGSATEAGIFADEFADEFE